ncbi:MAG: DUF2442 domain-containing protein [Acidobacteriaceae bacterium]|nr:DUF2442 domain-containing protein [Acidobacteriaceae bacterium]
MTEEELEAPLDAESEAMIERALAEARDPEPDEVATSVRYVPEQEMFVLTLLTGRRVMIPREELQDVAAATREQAADVVLDMLDSAVWWRTLDVAFSVKGLADGLRGNQRWMEKLAAQGRGQAA